MFEFNQFFNTIFDISKLFALFIIFDILFDKSKIDLEKKMTRVDDWILFLIGIFNVLHSRRQVNRNRTIKDKIVHHHLDKINSLEIRRISNTELLFSDFKFDERKNNFK